MSHSVKLSVSSSARVRNSSERVGLITLDFQGNYLKIIGKNSGFRDESFLWSHYSLSTARVPTKYSATTSQLPTGLATLPLHP